MSPEVKNERPLAMKALWKDFLEKAPADWEKGIALRLRFAHDSTLQLVFFRSKRSPEILVQVLLNGREATLPIKMAAPGSFYRWSDMQSILKLED